MEPEGLNWILICSIACHGDVPQERHVVFPECQVSLAELKFLHTLPFDAHRWAFGPSPAPRTVVTQGRETGRISGTICHRLRQRRAQHRNEAVVSIAHVWFSFLFGVVEAGRQPQLERSATSVRSLVETRVLVVGNLVMRNISAFGASLGALDRNTRPADSRLRHHSLAQYSSHSDRCARRAFWRLGLLWCYFVLWAESCGLGVFLSCRCVPVNDVGRAQTAPLGCGPVFLFAVCSWKKPCGRTDVQFEMSAQQAPEVHVKGGGCLGMVWSSLHCQECSLETELTLQKDSRSWREK